MQSACLVGTGGPGVVGPGYEGTPVFHPLLQAAAGIFNIAINDLSLDRWRGWLVQTRFIQLNDYEEFPTIYWYLKGFTI